ncbi:MAG: QueT transporter family protein [Oscillospiraceae bacterium]|jgi:uncharacterized membrane protein|nr:QueT transporter family protein [Oscillospiraceae bacterium]
MPHNNSLTRKITRSAVIGALYFALTIALAPISYGPVQFRVAEALCVLPFLFPESIIGLTLGCMFANIFGGFGLPDVIFGSLATFLACVCTAKCRVRWLAPAFPVIFNGIIVGALIAYIDVPADPLAAFPLIAASVAFGELAVGYALGLPLLLALRRTLKRA